MSNMTSPGKNELPDHPTARGEGGRATSASLRVREAEPADALEVAQVHVRSWQAAYRGLLPDAYLDALRPEERAARYTFGRASRDGPATFVAIQDEAIRGFATIRRSDSEREVGEVVALYVDPGCWGLGLGKRLIEEARRRLEERGFDEAILWVFAGNERAERFYRRDGWAREGARRLDEVWGITVDEVRYRRTLP
jgi:ribosomal protein S18 acetylase RimI-like enzyme